MSKINILWTNTKCLNKFYYLCESKVLQYFGNLFALFKFQQKQPNIQNRSHYVVSFEATFLPVLWSHADKSFCLLRQRTPSLKLPPPLGGGSVIKCNKCSLESEQIIIQKRQYTSGGINSIPLSF